MNIDYLHGDELEYELAIRGYPAEGTVAEKRSRLRPALRMEKEGIAFAKHGFIDFGEEIEVCTAKVKNLVEAVDQFNYSKTQTEVKKYRSRLLHIVGRLNRLVCPMEDPRKGELLTKCGEISDFLEESTQLMQPVKVPEFGSVIPGAEASSFSGTTTATNADVPNNSFRQVASDQSRNTSLLDVDPTELETAISDLQVNFQTHGTMSANTQAVMTGNTTTLSSVIPVSYPTSMSSATHGFGNWRTTGLGPVTCQASVPISSQPQQSWQRGQQPQTASAVEYRKDCPKPFTAGQRVTFPEDSVHGVVHGVPEVVTHDRLRVFKTVSQWQLKFNGLTGVNNFLEGVEELRMACGVTKTQLKGAAIVLFEGVALEWFRANVDHSHTWDNLVQMLRTAFLPGEYEEDIWADIRARTQGQQERVTTYISVMQNLFNKLGQKPSEEMRLRIIRRNLLPYIQQQLALTDFRTLPELTWACQRIEESQTRIDRFKPPPTNPMFVTERELMYNPRRYKQVSSIEVPTRVEASQNTCSSQATGATPRTVTKQTCWNCRQAGHIKRNCTQPHRKHCYGCGMPNVIKATCPRCSSENA